MTEGFYFYGFYMTILAVPVLLYLKVQGMKEGRAREASDKSSLFGDTPRAQHPHIDVSNCIGCQGCTSVCPEGDVLGMVGGKAAVVRPHRCIGHGMCAEACPVGAITMRKAAAGFSAELPYLTDQYETNVSNLFIAGELGGLALIRNAVNQGRDCIDIISERHARIPRTGSAYDVLIIGAGPAGISASLRAIERGLRFLTLERETVGGTVGKYPRQKLVMTGKVEFPIYGAFKKMELSKENLLEFWKKVSDREDFHVRSNEAVESIRREGEEFVVKSSHDVYRARAVVLAIGRSGTPRKLGVPGEDLPNVMYRLIDAEQYTHRRILVVGGGDSAVEAALGLALQKGNKVTVSYRKEEFARIKERNAQRVAEAIASRKLRVIFNSTPVEFRDDSVVLDVAGVTEILENDFVWIFAGGVAPNDFLKKIGIAFGKCDLAVEQEAHKV